MKRMTVMINGSAVKVKVRERDLKRLCKEQSALREAIMAEARRLPWYRRLWLAIFPAKQKQAKPATHPVPQGSIVIRKTAQQVIAK